MSKKKEIDPDIIAAREKLGRTIALIRDEKGYSQQKLSELSGVTWANISRIELGKYSPTLDTLNKIAKALDKKISIT